MKIRTTLNPATIIASLALLFSLTGTAVAGAFITGAQVKNASLTGIDVKNESLGTADIKNGSLLPKDFRAGSLPAGAQGPAGPDGPQGPGGPQGPAGLNGVSGHEIVLAASPLSSDAYRNVSATCPAGKKVVGGGGYAYNLGFPDEVAIIGSFPVGSTSWRVVAQETDPYVAHWFLKTYAVCVAA